MNCYGNTKRRLKKNLQTKMNKANQFFSEKFGIAQGTEYGEQYIAKNKLVENRKKFGDKFKTTIKKFLYPGDLVTRFKLSSSTAKDYPMTLEQPESAISDLFLNGMEEIGTDYFPSKELSRVLYDSSAAFKNLATLKNKMIDDIVTNVIQPQSLFRKDYEQLQRLKKKLENRRLDYDGKKRKRAKANSSITEEELRISERKFYDLKNVVEDVMTEFVRKDIDRANYIRALQRTLLHYHRQAFEVLQQLVANDVQTAPIEDARSMSMKTKFTVMPVECRMMSLPTSYAVREEQVPVYLRQPTPVIEQKSPVPSNSNNNDEVQQVDQLQPADTRDGLAASPELLALPALEINVGNEIAISPTNPSEHGGESALELQSPPPTSPERPPPPTSLEEYEALEDYVPDENIRANTLSFKKGDRLHIIRVADDNWLWGRTINGDIGYIPMNYVTRLGVSSITPPSSTGGGVEFNNKSSVSPVNNNNNNEQGIITMVQSPQSQRGQHSLIPKPKSPEIDDDEEEEQGSSSVTSPTMVEQPENEDDKNDQQQQQALST